VQYVRIDPILMSILLTISKSNQKHRRGGEDRS
jgi:hypothetical protein